MEKQITLSGRNILIVAILAALLVLVRITTVGTVHDEKLNAAIKAELRNDMGNNFSKAFAQYQPGQDVSALTDVIDDDALMIHSTAVSKPLLSLSSSARAVVKLEYTLPGEARKQEYWLFEHSTIAGWRYRQRSSSLSYYLNFF